MRMGTWADRGSGVEYSMDTFYRMDGCHAATLIGAAVHKEVNDDDYIAVIQWVPKWGLAKSIFVVYVLWVGTNKIVSEGTFVVVI